MAHAAAEELPQELWAQVLQHVGYKQRLSACALVCRKLARAAAAATQSLDLFFNSPERHDAFLGWTANHGSSLTHLRLFADPDHTPVRQLPCPNLLQLELVSCCVQLCASSEGMGLLHSCTALTHLDICFARSDSLLDGLPDVRFGGVPQLKHLALTLDLWAQLEAATLVDKALERIFGAHIASLEHLDLHCTCEGPSLPAPSCFLQHISTLVKLEEGVLHGAGPITAASLPGIDRLTALQDLEVAYCDLEPSCLLPLTTGLTRLRLESVTLQPRQAQQDSALGASQLLQLLTRCSALRELTLDSIKGDWPQQLAPYSALTASSNLQELQIEHCDIESAAWAHVFPTGRQLPQLHVFGGWGDRARGPFGSADTTRLVSCCPALKDVALTTQPDASLAALKSLTGLTGLEMYGCTVSPAVIRSELAALTRLRDLDVAVPAPGAGEAASSGLQHMVPLTALTGLTSLRGTVWASNKASAGSPVWVQLLEKCAADQAAQPAVISSMVRQLQQQGQQVTQLQQQGQQGAQLQQQHTHELAAARAEAAAAQAEAAEAKAEAAAARAGAAAAETQAAELCGRVQALEGQLREVLAALRQQKQQDLSH